MTKTQFKEEVNRLFEKVQEQEKATRPKGWLDGVDSKRNDYWQEACFHVENLRAEVSNFKARGY